MSDRKRFEKMHKGIRKSRRRQMSTMREKVIAIFCADIHLSLNAPIWRSAEPDWFAAMKRPLDEIRELQKRFACPILCAGDVFNKWDSCAELINWAIENLPDEMICIPGQHDLPLHAYEDITKSAYWSLVLSSKTNHLPCGEMYLHNERKIIITGFPFGCKIKEAGYKNNISFPDVPKIALAHEYKWIDGYSYPKASEKDKLGRNAVKFIDGKWQGYDVVIYGDNHKGFLYQFPNCDTQFFNCGTLMRRKSDEIDYKPQVGLLLESGKIVSHYLDTSKDKYLDIVTPLNETNSLDMKKFIKELEALDKTDLDFTDAMERYLKENDIKMEICHVIRKAMGK